MDNPFDPRNPGRPPDDGPPDDGDGTDPNLKSSESISSSNREGATDHRAAAFASAPPAGTAGEGSPSALLVSSPFPNLQRGPQFSFSSPNGSKAGSNILAQFGSQFGSGGGFSSFGGSAARSTSSFAGAGTGILERNHTFGFSPTAGTPLRHQHGPGVGFGFGGGGGLSTPRAPCPSPDFRSPGASQQFGAKHRRQQFGTVLQSPSPFQMPFSSTAAPALAPAAARAPAPAAARAPAPAPAASLKRRREDDDNEDAAGAVNGAFMAMVEQYAEAETTNTTGKVCDRSRPA